MKHFALLLIAVLLSTLGSSQTTVTYDFSIPGASTSGNLDANISFDTAQNFGTLPVTITNGQLRLDEDRNKGGSILINPLNGVTITEVIVNASVRTNDAAYTVDGGTEVEINISGGSYSITEIASVSLFEFYQKQNGNNKEIYVDNFSVTYTAPVDYTFNGTWTPSDPSGVATVNDTIIIESGNADLTASTTIGAIIVNPGAALEIGTSIDVTATTTTLESSSVSYASLILNGTLSGTIAYKRFANSNALGNDLISPPLDGETWQDFLISDTNAADLLDNGGSPLVYAFAPFVKSSDDFVNFNENSTATLNSGTGYRVATNSGTTLTFRGSVVTGQLPINIVDTGAVFPDWNLIGNPYPSYLDMTQFLEFVLDAGPDPDVTNISILQDASGIYGYDGDISDGWDIITLANSAGRLMAPGQGFFVAADDADVAAYDIIFDPSMRTTGSGNDFILSRNTEPLTFLKLNANTANHSYETEFYFNSNASQALDPGYDAQLWGGSIPNFALYSHLVENNSGTPIALQALHPSDLDDVTIPLGVNANQGEQLTFSISESTLDGSIEVYLDDMVANTSTLLTNSDYVLTPTVALSGTGRFFLRMAKSALNTSDPELKALNIYTDANAKAIVVAGQLFGGTSFTIYDLQGRAVGSSILDNNKTRQTIDTSYLSTGVYVVQLYSVNQLRTQKVIVR